MVLETKDLQALDLLSSPKAVVMRLRRRLRTHADTRKTVDSIGWKDAIEHSQLAAWWPSTEDTPDDSSCRCQINGELHLPIDLKPTSAMAHFRMEVCYWYILLIRLLILLFPVFCCYVPLRHRSVRLRSDRTTV